MLGHGARVPGRCRDAAEDKLGRRVEEAEEVEVD